MTIPATTTPMTTPTPTPPDEGGGCTVGCTDKDEDACSDKDEIDCLDKDKIEGDIANRDIDIDNELC